MLKVCFMKTYADVNKSKKILLHMEQTSVNFWSAFFQANAFLDVCEHSNQIKAIQCPVLILLLVLGIKPKV